MPPKIKITKEEILSASVGIVREFGASALSARSAAEKLGVSTQPIFSNYSSMDELKKDVIAEASRIYRGYIEREIADGKHPPYKASGIAYIRFAKEERELFKLLFMRDRTDESTSDMSENYDDVVEMLKNKTGLDEDPARLFHLEMWTFVHGIAAMSATSYLDLDYDVISTMMTDVFSALSKKIKEDE